MLCTHEKNVLLEKRQKLGALHVTLLYELGAPCFFYILSNGRSTHKKPLYIRNRYLYVPCILHLTDLCVLGFDI